MKVIITVEIEDYYKGQDIEDIVERAIENINEGGKVINVEVEERD